MREVQIFLERETALNALHPELAGRRRIFPVSYVPIDEADPFDPRIMGELRKLQWFDFTGLRFKEQHDEKVRTALSNLASGICRLINARVETPLTAAERDEAERRRADEAQARGKLEEADRLVREEEAERRRLQLEAEAEQRRAAELERARLAAEQARLAAEQAEAERLRREEEEKTRRERRGEGWDKDKRRMLVGAGCLALVLGVLAAIVIAPRLDSNRDAKAALAAITDKDWSTTSGVNLTAKGLKLATLAQMQKLADTGDAKAQTFMGLAYYAPAAGVTADNLEAGAWFHKAADRPNARALYNLGDIYDNGHGTPTDHERAAAWYMRSAALGNAMAQYALSVSYRDGQGVNKDPDQAMHWARKAADQGYPVAATQVGYLYEQGIGVPPNLTEAADWYRKAADLGDPVGQNNLGNAYSIGRGVTLDKAQAADWYAKAAAQGYAGAQYSLGLMYVAGDGVTTDLSRGRGLISTAAGAGNEKAKTWLAANPVSTTPLGQLFDRSTFNRTLDDSLVRSLSNTTGR